MQTEEIERLIIAGLPGSKVRVSGDGRHFEAIVITDAFAGKSLLEQQRMVFATLGNKVESGEIHALSMRTYTAAEWEKFNHQ